MDLKDSIRIYREAVKNYEAQIKSIEIRKLLDQIVEMQDGTQETFLDSMNSIKLKKELATSDQWNKFFNFYDNELTDEAREVYNQKYGVFLDELIDSRDRKNK